MLTVFDSSRSSCGKQNLQGRSLSIRDSPPLASLRTWEEEERSSRVLSRRRRIFWMLVSSNPQSPFLSFTRRRVRARADDPPPPSRRPSRSSSLCCSGNAELIEIHDPTDSFSRSLESEPRLGQNSKARPRRVFRHRQLGSLDPHVKPGAFPSFSASLLLADEVVAFD